MAFHRETFQLRTRGRTTYDVTAPINAIVGRSGVPIGLCTVFVHHTSASLIITENADDRVRKDLDAFLARLVQDGDALFSHRDEGPDDMPAHIRSVLTQTSLSVPVEGSRCALGTWQGIYLWEHRHAPHERTITVSIIGP